jgi:monoamine oxidase
MRALAKELGVDLYRPDLAGKNDIVYSGDTPQQSPASGPVNTRSLLDVVAPDATAAFRRLDAMARDVPADRPWEAAGAADLDSQTMEGWKNANIQSRQGRDLADLLVWSATSADPAEVSLLYMLGYLNGLGEPGSPGGAGSVFDFILDSDLVDGGLEQLAAKMAAELRRRVVLRAPARRIVQTARRVRVESDHLAVEARQAIVAMPPSVSGHIAYSPDLPALRAELVNRYPQGTMVTFSFVYDRPFWRDKGLSGRVGAHDFEPVHVVLDHTPPGVDVGIITGQSWAAKGRRVMQRPPAERRQAALQNMATFFGDEALRPMGYTERIWSAPQWTRGCPGYLPPGVLKDHGPAIRAPFGRVRWAGAEYSPQWNTYLDGAVRSGEQVAADALAAL